MKTKRQNYGYGCIPSPKDLRNYRISAATKAIELPETFEVAHSHIKNQGSVGSCVAHGISEILETNDGINYSTGWIYGYRPDDYYQGTGMVTCDALKTINKVGYLENSQLDVNEEMDAAKLIVDANLDTYTNQAASRKIKSYAELRNIDEIKQAVYASGKPVIVCIDIDKNGLQLTKDYVAKVVKEPHGGHLVVCYGWNEKGLLIQNSWGEDWGNKGTFILPYDYPFYEAWMINFKGDEDDVVVPTPTPDVDIVKPDWYWLRDLIMMIVKFIRSLKK